MMSLVQLALGFVCSDQESALSALLDPSRLGTLPIDVLRAVVGAILPWVNPVELLSEVCSSHPVPKVSP